MRQPLLALAVLALLIPRAYAARSPGTLDVRDYGAACDGVADDHAALVAAQAAGQRMRAAEIVIPAGCRLNLAGKLVYTVDTNSWRFGAGSRIISGGIQGLLDQTATNEVTYSKATSLDANENNVAAYGLYNISKGLASYQKNGFYSRVTSLDPSSYRIGTLTDLMNYGKDLVGYEAQVSAGPGNMVARLYGYHTQVTFPAGSDGNSWAAELETSNAGAYTAQQGKAGSKGALHLTDVGPNDMTVGLDIDASPARFENDITAWQRGTRSDGWFLYYGTTPTADMALDPVFGVAHDGHIVAPSATVPRFNGATHFDGPMTLEKTAVFADTRQIGNQKFTAGHYQYLSSQTGVVARGHDARTATVLENQVNVITICPAGTGVLLPRAPTAEASVRIVVLNRSGVTCLIYSTFGSQIENASSGGSIVLASGKDVSFTSAGTTRWYQ